jgi:hypothetical protein
VDEALSWVHGRQSWKFGGSFIRTQMNVYQATVPNGLIIFSPSFPTSDAFANLLLGSPVVFYQGLGDFGRGFERGARLCTRKTSGVLHRASP